MTADAGTIEGSGLILINGAGRVLLQRRDDDTPPAGYGRWAIPGGHREGEESHRETALRDFREETGVEIARLRFFHSFTEADHGALAGRTLHLYFADDHVDEAAIEVNEGLAFRFWSPEEALALPMNPGTRFMLERFFAHDKYSGSLRLHEPFRRGAALAVLDRWGRILLQLRDADLPPERFPDQWSLPGGMIEEDEAPDAAALREFEEETGHLLEECKLYRVFRREGGLPGLAVDVQHVYYADPDIDEEAIEVREGQAFRYFGPGETEALAMPAHAREIVRLFFESPAYKGLFH